MNTDTQKADDETPKSAKWCRMSLALLFVLIAATWLLYILAQSNAQMIEYNCSKQIPDDALNQIANFEVAFFLGLIQGAVALFAFITSVRAKRWNYFIFGVALTLAAYVSWIKLMNSFGYSCLVT